MEQAEPSLSWNRYVIAFHGCARETANAVLHEGASLNLSGNDYDWLGHGAYFWEESPERAMEWAIEQLGRARSKSQPAVIGAVIDLGNCLNLLRPVFMDYLRKSYDKMKQTLQEANQPLPENRKGFRRLDCHVFNYLHELLLDQARPPFQTIRCFFPEGEPVYPGASILRHNHIQICVRDPKCIVGFFEPQ